MANILADHKKLSIIKYSIILLPVLLITGPFLSDLSVVISAITILFILKKKELLELKKNIYIKYFLIFWLYICLNSLTNNINFDSLKISFSFIRFGLFFIAIYYVLSKDKNDDLVKKLHLSLTICFTALSLDGFLQYFSGKNILGFELIPGPRVSSFFGDESILGSYVARLFPLYFGLTVFLNKKQKANIYLPSVLFVFLEVLVFLSGERTAFFYMNASAFFILIMINEYRKLRLFTYVISVLIILGLFFFHGGSKNRYISKTLEQMNIGEKKIEINQNFSDNKIYIFSIHHHSYYHTSYKMFLDNPFIGVGVKNFRNFCDNKDYKYSKFSCNTHPHNTYLQLLAELGIIGFVFLIFVLIIFLYYCFIHLKFKMKKKIFFNSLEICILSSIFIYIIPFVPTGNFFNNWVNIIHILPLGFFYWSRKKLIIK